jgi:hypothetical protein
MPEIGAAEDLAALPNLEEEPQPPLTWENTAQGGFNGAMGLNSKGSSQ